MITQGNSSQVSYCVKVKPEQHEIEVTMHLTGPVASGRIRLEVPTWVPGDYSFAPYARDLFDLHAKNSAGAPLEVNRDGWQAFHVEGGDGDVTVTYRAWAYATEFGEPSGILDSAYGIFLGTRYLHSPAHLGECVVTYELPSAWEKTVHHPSGAEQKGPLQWRYPSYEILLDTPVVMGAYDIFKRDVGGTPFYFVFVDRGVGFDEEAPGWMDKVAAVASTFLEMFGSFPFQDYTFVLSLNPQAEWGLEHLTSTMCGLGPNVFTDPDRYANGVRVCAHELFHAWNVRRLRPDPLKKLACHLTSGSFSEGLWMAEGFTRYYEFLSCTRKEVYTPDQFFSSVVGYLEHLRVTPSYKRVSGADSSLATYLNHSKYPGRTANSIDYYDKGMLIAFGLDATLRLSTNDQSLDTAFRGFYEKYVSGAPEYAGYTTQDTIDYFNSVLPGLGAQIEATVRRPGGLTTEAILEQLGFTVQHKKVKQLGIMFLNDQAPTLYNVLDDTPAGRSGLAPEDVISGVNGYVYSPSALSWAATHDAPVTLEVLRGQRRFSFTMTPAETTRIAQLVWNGDESQAERLYVWLQQKFPLTQGQVFNVDFYENFHGIETIM